MKTTKEFNGSSEKSSEHVTYARFTDFTEVYSPNYEADLKAFLQEMEDDVRSSVNTEGRAVRQAHAKSYGLLRAKVAVAGGLAPEFSQGIFASPAEYEAVVRFSNGLAHVRPDALLGTGCGMGIKMFGVPGPSLIEDEREAGTFDYAFINAPIFFCNTIRDYRHVSFKSLPDALADPVGRNSWLHQFLTDGGALPPEKWLWDELLAFLSNLHIPWQNLLSYTYWSMGAVRHGDYIAKVRSQPTADSMKQLRHRDVDPKTSREPFRETLVSEAREREHHFDLQVQLRTDPTRMPVQNTSIEWREELSPFVTVARITIPAQDISQPTNLEAADKTSIMAWRVREAHRPLGEIMRARKEVYQHSSVLRHQLNKQERREPSSPQEALGISPKNETLSDSSCV
jgi:hypothetical protein